MSEATNQVPPEPEEAIDPEVIPPEETRAVATIPETITQLAVPGAEGKAIIEARKQILEHAMRSSILLTFPEDWTKFRDSVSGRVTCYLGDNGCKRVIGMWQIQPIIREGPTKDELGNEYAYSYYGDAYCRLTDTWERDLEGTRFSNDQYARQYPEGLQREFRVKQAALANFKGNCVRRLAGLQSVPESFLDEVWKGTGKTTAKCAEGRGYGSRQDREGTTTRTEGAPDTVPPTCDAENCNLEMKYYPGGSRDGRTWQADWKCPKYKWDSEKRESVGGHSKISAADWEKLAASKAPAGQDPAATHKK